MDFIYLLITRIPGHSYRRELSQVCVVVALITHMTSSESLRGFNFSWWGCYDLFLRHKPTELAHSFYFFFYSVLASISVFMALSGVFHFINFPPTLQP